MSSTLEVLQWARQATAHNEVVSMFWERLCDAVSEPVSASASRIEHEISTYGANSIATVFRGGDGVDYAEVAYDVAETLRGWFEDAPYKEGDARACERFVLGKMNICGADLAAMASAANAATAVESQAVEGVENALEGEYLAVVQSTVAAAFVRECGQAVSAQVSRKVVAIVAEQVAAHGVQKISREAVAEIAAVVAREVVASVGTVAVEQAGKEAARQVMRRVGQTAVEQSVEAAARKAAEKTAKKVVARLAQKLGEEAAKRAAQQAAKKAAQKAAEQAARKAAEQAARAAAERVVGIVLQSLGVVMLAWTIVDLAGPAKRVTIPAVVFVALLRVLHDASQGRSCPAVN